MDQRRSMRSVAQDVIDGVPGAFVVVSDPPAPGGE
jgi:hypothetical protein